MHQRSHLAQTLKGQIEYVIQGEGETCVILHGGHSNCHEAFGVEEIRAANMSALIPSRPGYGKTAARVGESAAAAAYAMIMLLDHLSIAKVSVLAISAGGPTALQLAARYPERLEKLVLESAVSTRWLKPEEALYKMARRMFRPGVQGMTWGMLRTLTRLAPSLIYRQMIPSFSKLKTEDVLATLSNDDKAAFSHMLLHLSSGHGFMLDIEHEIPTATLASILIPTLIVHSRNDNSVAFEHALHARDHIEGAELFEAQTWGHLIWLGGGSTEAKARVTAFLLE